MRYTVVLTATFPEVARRILAPHFDVVEHPTEQERSEEDVMTLLAEADAAITLLSDPVTRRVLESNPNLRIVSNFAAGYNNIDIDAARELGIVVANTPGVLTEATADLTMALLLAVTRRIVEGDAVVRSSGRCEWEPGAYLGASLQDKTLGILGMGRIGSAVAQRARAFGLNILGVRRGEPVAPMLAASDIVSLHAPLTEETRHVINASSLQAMKPRSYLINTARGPLVDESALCDTLESGHLRGAALDVYEREPEVNARLLGMRNVILAPHIGSATEEARDGMARLAATNVLRLFQGAAPPHRIV